MVDDEVKVGWVRAKLMVIETEGKTEYGEVGNVTSDA